ncbi:Putative GIY-YIG endonuclease, Zinc finger, RING/FYVE/PHD-type, GIY-YIG endonuclease superfamily [Septoria linicola]|uniref:GIY-YIG endonuclease, Zinc finger, RING/FYVE/PHD-type, GIY-YIG endonuclease superfamily n=1 Tax=Septoria linicola TaxID=215465 RepID=A0A9Q9AM82_9PEZI|nr:Putative GIY-YIG endonuclease, Zinc finger, RING/FYVE/PHD-type, GIY-YIG endonuclease superfamily [Septoria linicola]
MEKCIAPIPALYVCYLLRSIARHSSLYIGSTPHPPRRLRQHNGESKGGAVRTSKDSLRPWEMTCLVTGFPSKIAALQFEWAWQNPQMTRHITPDSRITQAKMTSRISPKTGKVRKRSKRPRLSLTERLRNLHLLLRARSFRLWPLQLTFYCEDVHRLWNRLVEQTTESLPNGFAVQFDESCRAQKSTNKGRSDAQPVSIESAGIQALDVGYTSLKQHLEKSQKLFDGTKTLPDCSICRTKLATSGAATLTCPRDGCSAGSHLQCLSSHFQSHSKSGTHGDILTRSTGTCPVCGCGMQWIDLVKELSLRMRGEKEVKAIFKPKRAEKGLAAVLEDDSESSDAEDEPLQDQWPEIEESSDEEAGPSKLKKPATLRSDPVRKRKPLHALSQAQMPFSEPIIQDSESDEAELLT